MILFVSDLIVQDLNVLDIVSEVYDPVILRYFLIIVKQEDVLVARVCDTYKWFILAQVSWNLVKIYCLQGHGAVFYADNVSTIC